MNSSTQIYIDFEGNKDSPPTFIGVLECTDNTKSFYQYILEDGFKILAPSAQHQQLKAGTIDSILTSIHSRHSAETPIYAWSSHEQDVIDILLSGTSLSTSWNNRIIDAKKIAKRWARTKFPEHQFEKTDFRGRHTLDQYLELIGYKVPTVHGAGKTGSRLTKIREMISTERSFDDWPPSVKSHWTKLLAHNMHDCYGTKAIVDAISGSA
jgi:hypothetical protein